MNYSFIKYLKLYVHNHWFQLSVYLYTQWRTSTHELHLQLDSFICHPTNLDFSKMYLNTSVQNLYHTVGIHSFMFGQQCIQIMYTLEM